MEKITKITAILALLLLLGFSVHAKSPGELMWDAGFSGNVQQLKILIDDGLDVNTQMEGGGPTGLIAAASKGHIKAIEFLIQKGADVNLQTVAGMTALMFAAMNNHHETVKLLLKNGAQKELKEKNGYTALMMAEDRNHYLTANILKNYKGNDTISGSNNFSSSNINGAFGMNLGDTFDPADAIGAEKLTDGTSMYQFDPSNNFRGIQKYYVLVTPISHQVYSIWGLSDIESGRECIQELDQTRELLKSKYGKPKQQGLHEQLEGIETIVSGNRYIQTFCTRFMDIKLQIQYYDRELMQLADTEKKQLDKIEFNEKAKDSSAL